MKKFTKHILALLVTLTLLIYISDTIYTYIYMSKNPRNKLQYILNLKKQNYEYLFLGSSRVANHIDTKVIDSLTNKRSINLGVEGASLNDNLLQLKLFMKNNTVSTLFLQLDFNYQSTAPSNIVTSEAMPFIDNKIVYTHVKSYFDNYLLLKHVPFYKYAINAPKIGFREFFLKLINKKPRIKIDDHGFIPLSGNKEISGQLPKNIAHSNTIVDSIVKICNKNKVRLVFYTAPFSSKTKNIDYITKLKYKYPELNNFSTGYKDSLFYNWGHLNHKGAKLFTSDFYNKCILKK